MHAPPLPAFALPPLKRLSGALSAFAAAALLLLLPLALARCLRLPRFAAAIEMKKPAGFSLAIAEG